MVQVKISAEWKCILETRGSNELQPDVLYAFGGGFLWMWKFPMRELD